MDDSGLAPDLERLYQIDHAHVREVSRKSGSRFALFDVLLFRLLENHPRAGDDLFDVDRLGQIVVAAQLEALHFELDRLLIGEKHERNLLEALIRLEDPAQLES